MRELTSEECAVLLHQSHTRSRREQRRYLQALGGIGTANELDQAISLAKHDTKAVELAERLDDEWREEQRPPARGVNKEVSQAVCWFTQSVMAGHFGPDDSRDG